MTTSRAQQSSPGLPLGESLPLISSGYRSRFLSYLATGTASPLLLLGDAVAVLRELPDETIDCCMTSPPYWGQRAYRNGGIGAEQGPQEFIARLCQVFGEVRRILKPAGSFWLNIGDSYQKKGLLGIPWRLAFALSDQQGWIIRNSVIWNKVKGGPDTAPDKLRNVYENVFHFVKSPKGYYYDVDAIRSHPRKAKIRKGAVVSATGVSGVRYKRQIELSTALSAEERRAAFTQLEGMLRAIEKGELADFRMIIRGQQRTTHSDSELVSGRARELKEKGFYFLRYHPRGSKPADVWDIIPEDTQKRRLHFAPYPEDLCKIPILATCPATGVVLDPFCGTGTTLLAARNFNRKSVGIDISREYLELAQERCASLL